MSQRAALTLATAIALLVAAAALNPSPERHRAEIAEAIGERHLVARMLGVGTLAAVASSYRSLGLASYTTLGDKVLSVGALGVVFVSE